MELYIRIKDGQPFEHPIFGDNFRAVFPNIDTDNLPPEFARFERIAPPALNVYEVNEVTYAWVDGVVKDVHSVRQMTNEEIIAKQNQIKTAWANDGYASWIFDETSCSFQPPTPYPDDGKRYRWDEATTSWKETESTPA